MGQRETQNLAECSASLKGAFMGQRCTSYGLAVQRHACYVPASFHQCWRVRRGCLPALLEEGVDSAAACCQLVAEERWSVTYLGPYQNSMAGGRAMHGLVAGSVLNGPSCKVEARLLALSAGAGQRERVFGQVPGHAGLPRARDDAPAQPLQVRRLQPCRGLRF